MYWKRNDNGLEHFKKDGDTMIGEFITNYSEIGYAGIVIITMIWLVRYLVKQTTEDKLYYRELITNDMKDLHNDSLKNADLNKESIVMLKTIKENHKEHNNYTRKLGEKTLKAFDILCDRMNGGSPASLKLKKELELYKQRGIVDRREIDKKVEVERRK